jgi:small subunit ribosomal protein S4
MRCYTVKCPIDKGRKQPGQHGGKRLRTTDYGIRLREKQKVKRIYGVLDRQFKRYFLLSSKMSGNTGENLLLMLEKRLDNVAYRLCLAHSRKQARQMIRHGHFLVNGKKITIPSLSVEPGDTVEPATKSREIVKNILSTADKTIIPSWLKLDEENLKGQIIQTPNINELQIPINEMLVVEFSSR